MDYCKICPECGARLDPGEICDCLLLDDLADELAEFLTEGDGDE